MVGSSFPIARGQMDGVPTGNTPQRLSKQKGVSIKQPDFLLYMATVSGTKAFRNVLIQHLIKSLEELTPSNCMSEACLAANKKIADEIKHLDSKNQTGQCAKIENTLKGKFCIGKYFSAHNQ